MRWMHPGDLRINGAPALYLRPGATQTVRLAIQDFQRPRADIWTSIISALRSRPWAISRARLRAAIDVNSLRLLRIKAASCRYLNGDRTGRVEGIHPNTFCGALWFRRKRATPERLMRWTVSRNSRAAPERISGRRNTQCRCTFKLYDV